MCQNKVIRCAVCSVLAMNILPVHMTHAAHNCEVVKVTVSILLEKWIWRREFSIQKKPFKKTSCFAELNCVETWAVCLGQPCFKCHTRHQSVPLRLLIPSKLFAWFSLVVKSMRSLWLNCSYQGDTFMMHTLKTITVSKLWSERENQQDATVRCLLSTHSQHVSGIIMPIFRRPRRVLLHVVCCTGTAGCGCGTLRYQPHPAVPAQHTTCSNTRLGLLKMGIMMPETCW